MQNRAFLGLVLFTGASALSVQREDAETVVQSDGHVAAAAAATSATSSSKLMRRAPPTAADKTSKAKPDVALCIAGQPRGLVEGQSKNLQENLISALGAVDVMVAGPTYPGLPEPEMKSLFEPLGAAQSRINEQPRVEQLWRSVYESAPEADFKTIEAFGDFGGATLFGPSFGNGQGMFQWYWRDQCLQMIEQQEKLRGSNYSRVVVTRFDYKWVAPHPPLSLLTTSADVWTPAGSEESGLNDHHAVLTRQAANVWLGVYRSLLNGEAAELLKRADMKKSWRNNECYLKFLAAKSNLTVKPFPPTAAVRSCPRGGAFTCKYEFCPQEEGTLSEFKDCEEARFAKRTLSRIKRDGGWLQQHVDHPWDN